VDENGEICSDGREKWKRRDKGQTKSQMRKVRKAPTGIEPIAVYRGGNCTRRERERCRGRVYQGGRRRRTERGRGKRGRKEREGN